MKNCILGLGLMAALMATEMGSAADCGEDNDQDLANHVPIAAAIGKWNEITLYEGLPHQQAEKALLADELKTKKIAKFHDYPFYAEELFITDVDSEASSKLLANPASLEKHQGKFCGDFHPDYCLEWKVGKETWLALICLGCHEVKFYGPKKLCLYCDLKDDAYDELKKILVNYQKNRPPSRFNRAKKEKE